MRSMSKKIRVVIADDHPMFRAGVAQALKSGGSFDVVGEAGNGPEAVQLAERLHPQMVLLDVNMPGCGLQAAAAIARADPSIHVVMLTVSETEESVNAALEAGAKGYVLKGASSVELVRVLQGICEGEAYVTPSLAAKLLTQLRQKPPVRERNTLSDLTSREEEILAHAARGLTNKEIARSLTLSEKTVKHYMTNVLHKLQVRNRVEAVIQMRRQLQ
jgi:two-component system, NarL family, nitrate/nitrite response regulator NarL